MGAFVPLIQFKISNYSQLTNTIWGVDNLLIGGEAYGVNTTWGSHTPRKYRFLYPKKGVSKKIMK